MARSKPSREMVARAARVYRRNQDAARALYISATAFTDHCEKFGIETPAARRRRRKAQARE